jgi:hypothetical protein
MIKLRTVQTDSPSKKEFFKKSWIPSLVLLPRDLVTNKNSYLHMQKIFFLIMISVSLKFDAISQDIDTNKLKRQATEMAESFMKGDYAKLVKYTYPKVVEMMGGPEKMIQTLKKSLDDIKSKGYTILSAKVALTPLKAQAGKEIHAVVVQTIVMTVPGGTLTSNSYLLGISSDKGSNWYFVDSSPLRDINKLRMIFPNFNPELKIPEKQPPVFKKDE